MRNKDEADCPSDEKSREPERDTMELAREWKVEGYHHQARNVWPGRGQQILAQYDEDSIVVYQAFNKTISDYVCKHGTFDGCPGYNPTTRMTWIKTNFLWMMFRCNWATRPNQERVVAVWIRRPAFDFYLECARKKGPFAGKQVPCGCNGTPTAFRITSATHADALSSWGCEGLRAFGMVKTFCR